MKTIKVKDLMTKISDYPTVSTHASLGEALMAMEAAEKRFEEKGDKPRAVLILDEEDRVVGKLTGWDVLRALEPKYKSIGDEGTVRDYGLNATFLKSMVNIYGLLQGPLDRTCSQVANVQVSEIMTCLDERALGQHEKQVLDEDANLNEAIHLFVMGDYLSLYVRRDKEIVGVLRLVDVCNVVCDAIKKCIS